MGLVNNLSLMQKHLRETKCSLRVERTVTDCHCLRRDYSHLIGVLVVVVVAARERKQMRLDLRGVAKVQGFDYDGYLIKFITVHFKM